MKEKIIKILELNRGEWERIEELLKSKLELFIGKLILLPDQLTDKKNILEKYGIGFISGNGTCFRPSKPPRERIKVVEKWKERKVEMVERVIRSGQTYRSKNHLIFTNRINRGARVYGEGAIVVLDEFEGELIGEGPFLIVLKNYGTIIYKGEELEPGKGELVVLTERSGNE